MICQRAWLRGERVAQTWLLGCLLGASACTSGSSGGEEIALRGRAFSTDTGKALSNAALAVGAKRARSDAEGRFEVEYKLGTAKDVELSGKGYAPVKKPVPAGDGYLELMAKGYDFDQEIDPQLGGTYKTKQGAAVTLPAGGLQGGGSAGQKVKLSMAVPDPRKLKDLSALPGNSDAKKGQKRGKVSTNSPVYVSATAGDKALALSQKAKLAVPVIEKVLSKADGEEQTLFRFDEATGLWVEIGSVTRGQDENGHPIFEGETSELGWFTVGSFYDQLTCVRACVVDEDEEPVPFARAVLTGIDDFTQIAAYAGKDGCFSAEVRADARLSLSVQANSGFVSARLVQSASGGRLEDTSSCQDVGTLVLAPREDEACPSGFSLCGGESCVDLSSDDQHCGACNRSCRVSACVVGSCGEQRPVDPTPDAGMPADGGTGSGDDASMPGERDVDADGVPNVEDNCLNVANPEQRDQDQDGVGDACDNCPGVPNATQSDQNNNSVGDACEPDTLPPDAGEMPVDAATDAATTDASSPDSSTLDGGADAGCSGCVEHYTGASYPLDTMYPCCAEDACGLQTFPLIDYGVTQANACVRRSQEGVPVSEGTCPVYGAEGAVGAITFDGCCRPDNTCGHWTDMAWVFTEDGASEMANLGFGCATSADLGFTLATTTCAYEGDGGITHVTH